ncbi:MAG: 5-formyltetrahydrofolate cyclo-ligase [Alphaproteobacteria bacterium]|nr:5-formyltetrahydrofolate cyclo-ligase [Alphaproteobacteria bacterium]
MKNTIEQKKDLRTQSLQNRKILNELFQLDAANLTNLTQNCVTLINDIKPKAKSVSGYIPIKHEANPYEIMKQLSKKRYDICLPVVVQKNSPLIFRNYNFNNTEMEKGAFGTTHPKATSKEIIPSVMIIPMLAFDRKGFRLGFGGGFYDRTIEKLKQINIDIMCIGLAFAGQEIENIPHDKLDQQLDWIVTEKEVIKAI